MNGQTLTFSKVLPGQNPVFAGNYYTRLKTEGKIYPKGNLTNFVAGKQFPSVPNLNHDHSRSILPDPFIHRIDPLHHRFYTEIITRSCIHDLNGGRGWKCDHW